MATSAPCCRASTKAESTRKVDMAAKALQPSIAKILEQDAVYRQLLNDHPIEARLLLHAIEQIDSLRVLMSSYSERQLSADSFLSEFNRLWPHLIETISWVRGDVQQADLKPPSLQELLSRGYADNLAMKYLNQFSKRRRGRPITTRQLAVKALEMRARDPRWSWSRLATSALTRISPPALD